MCSCKNNEQSKNNGNPMGNKKIVEIKNDYQPGIDWKLVWADEFESNEIDQNNWSLQIVKAGRFNEEWQRYTASSENAYVKDS